MENVATAALETMLNVNDQRVVLKPALPLLQSLFK